MHLLHDCGNQQYKYIHSRRLGEDINKNKWINQKNNKSVWTTDQQEIVYEICFCLSLPFTVYLPCTMQHFYFTWIAFCSEKNLTLRHKFWKECQRSVCHWRCVKDFTNSSSQYCVSFACFCCCCCWWWWWWWWWWW